MHLLVPTGQESNQVKAGTFVIMPSNFMGVQGQVKQRDSSGFWKSSGSMTDISTTSGIRAWWLSKVKGYKIRSIVQMPRLGSFGRVKYYRRWILAPGDDKTVQ